MPRQASPQLPPPDLFARAKFDGFGPSRFHPNAETPGGYAVKSRTISKLRQAVKADAPRRPGVYGMLDTKNRVIYIGKAKNLRARLLSYFRTDSRNPKAGRILRHTRTLVWEFAETEFAALLRELELIQLFRPRFNVLGMPGRQRYFYVCVGRGPAHACYVAKAPAGKDVTAYGPFVGRSRAELAVRRVNDVFRLRDCAVSQSMAFADQRELFPLPRAAGCLRHELGTCLGPCGGYATRREYGAAVRAARAFFDGRDRSVLETLTKQMLAASAEMNFERAMAVRDKLADLEWLDQRLTLLRRARDQQTFVLPTAAHDGRPLWYVLHRGQICGASRPPECPDSRTAFRVALTETIAGRPPAGPHACHPVDSVLLVAAWLRKCPADKLALRHAADVLAELVE